MLTFARQHRRRTASSLAVLSLVAIVAAACGGGSSGSATGPTTTTNPSPAAATVTATSGLAFSPSSVSIAPGGKVTFTVQSVQHNVTFSATTGAPADIGNTANASVDRTFATAGTFAYHCTIHPGMTGTVIVAATTTTTSTGGQGCGTYFGC